MGGGGGGGGGRSNGGRGRAGGFAPAQGGGNVQAARQLLLSLLGEGGHGGGNGAGQRRGGGGARQREGEWTCSCGFANRAFRVVCHSCGQPRLSGGGKGQTAKATARAGWTSDGGAAAKGGWAAGKGGRGSVANGPIGADGRRPMLGKYGGARDPATHPVSTNVGKMGKPKGGEVAWMGPPQGKGPGGPTGGGAQGPTRVGGSKHAPTDKGGKGAWSKPPRSTDADGFTLVQPRRVWQGAAEAAEPRGDADQPLGAKTSSPPPTRPRWADEEETDGEDYMLDDVEAEEAEGEGEHEVQVDDDPGPQLRAKYNAYAKAVREMEKRMRGDTENPALVTLRDARDQAEKAWREAKTPAPLSTRMGRAQTKLDRAEAALARARHAVDSFDEWVDAQRKDLLQRVEDADQWYRWRQHQMDELHEEAGGRVQLKTGATDAMLGRHSAVSERIMGGWLPAVQALLEHVQGNPEIEEKLACIAADMQSAGQELAADRTSTAEQYDIGGDDNSQWGVSRERADDTPGDTSASGHDATTMAAAGWRPEGPGRWARNKGDSDRNNVPTTEPSSRHDGDGGTTPPATAGGDAGPIGQAAGATTTGNKRGAAEQPTEAKGPVRQKTDAEAREELDRRRAAELLQQQHLAIEAQKASHDAGAGGFGSETAQTVAAQHFLAQVCKAVEQARTMGVEPRAGNRQLVELSPEELKQWVDEHIGSEHSWA